MGLVEPVAEVDGENREYGTENVPTCPEIADIFAPAVNEHAAAAVGNDDKQNNQHVEGDDEHQPGSDSSQGRCGRLGHILFDIKVIGIIPFFLLFGWHADARSCSLVLADAPARFTSPRCFLEFSVGMMTPLACRDAPAPAAAPARSSHTASRNVRRCVQNRFNSVWNIFFVYGTGRYCLRSD